MAANSFFPSRPQSRPTVYAYSDSNPQYDGQLKIGYTTRTAAQRLDDIYNIQTPGPKPYRIVLEESAMRHDGTAFTDKDVHRHLKAAGFRNSAGRRLSTKRECECPMPKHQCPINDQAPMTNQPRASSDAAPSVAFCDRYASAFCRLHSELPPHSCPLRAKSYEYKILPPMGTDDHR